MTSSSVMLLLVFPCLQLWGRVRSGHDTFLGLAAPFESNRTAPLSLRRIALPLQQQLLSDSDHPWCPHALDVAPCVCDGPQTFILLTCDGMIDLYEFWNVFRKPFPASGFGKLTLQNSDVSRIPKGTFGNLKFEYILMKKNTLSVIEHEALDSSRDSLKRLEVVHNNLEKFPFADLLHFSKLEYLDLYYNALKRIPDFAFGYHPKLRSINLSFNLISYVGSYAFQNLPSLEKLDLRYNKLTVLNNDAFSLRVPNSKLTLDISCNRLLHLADGAFLNQIPAVLNVSHNILKTFPEKHFGPILRGMEERNAGVIDTSGNRFRCKCGDVDWAARLTPRFKRHLLGFVCADIKKTLLSLTPEDLQCSAP